jgi:NADH-quinone oxidoreductase subunit I
MYDVVGMTRQEMIFDKEKLLKVYDETIAKKPM